MTYKIVGVRKKIEVPPTAALSLAEAEREISEAQANLRKKIEAGIMTQADEDRLSRASANYERERAKPIK